MDNGAGEAPIAMGSSSGAIARIRSSSRSAEWADAAPGFDSPLTSYGHPGAVTA